MSQDNLDPRLITEAGIRRLLSFLPRLSDQDTKQGQKPRIEETKKNFFSISPATLSKTASNFVQACYEENFVQPFDWNDWNGRHANELNAETFIAQADMARIVRLLTTHIRMDRFCDGHLLSVLEDGKIARILTRLREITSDKSPPGYPGDAS